MIESSSNNQIVISGLNQKPVQSHLTPTKTISDREGEFSRDVTGALC